MKVNKVTSILKANGFIASKSTWVREGNTRRKVLVPGYKASQHGAIVGIECCGCPDKLANIIIALSNAGMNAKEVVPGGGYVKVW